MSPSTTTTRAVTTAASPEITQHQMTHQNTTNSTNRTTDSKENDRAHLGIMIRRSGAPAVAGAGAASLPLAGLLLSGGA